MAQTDRSELVVGVADLESMGNAPLYGLCYGDPPGQAINWGPVLGLALIVAPWFLIAWSIWMWA
jgi:hypothetical protein